MRLFTGGGWRRAFAFGCLGLALCRAEAASASTFRVSPVQVTLSATNPSALLTIANESDEALRFQVSAFSWDQDARGRMQLTPTQDVVFFPMMLTLQPGEERRVRVGSLAPPGATEKTYRLFVEELPAVSAASTDAAFHIRVLTKFGIPIFLQPDKPHAEVAVELRGISEDRIRFAMRNTGNAHFLLQKVHLRGTGAAGEALLDREAEGWYLLAGGEREYEQALSPGACAGLTSLAVDAETDRGTMTARVAVPPPLCEPATASAASLASE